MDLDEIIKAYLSVAQKGDSHSEIARRIINDKRSDLSLRTLRFHISEYRAQNEDLEYSGYIGPETEQQMEPGWEVQDDYYLITYRDSYLKFPVSRIDQIFLDFSSRGKNLSQHEVMVKYDIRPAEWHAIKNGLGLYKASDIFSPYTMENTPREDLEAMIEEKMAKLFRSKDVTIKAYQNSLNREYKKAINRLNLKELENQAFADHLLEHLERLTPITLKTSPEPRPPKEATVGVLVVADLHIGAETAADLSRTPRFDSAILKSRLSEVAQNCNSRGYDEVIVVCLGDLIESFTGLNHKNSWKGVEKGMWGSEVVIKAYEILSGFISELHNFSRLYTVSGNHDRSTSANDEDTTGEIGRLIAYFLQTLLGKNRVEDLGDIGSFVLGDCINVIPTHGHLYLSKQRAAEMAWKYGKQGYYNLILEGHLHSLMIKTRDEGMDFLKIICKSVFSGNLYSDQSGFDGSAGYLFIEVNKALRKPRIIIEHL